MKFPETQNKIVCIVGSGYTSESCVFNNNNKDYWSLNNMFEDENVPAAYYDEWFQLHRPGSGEGHVDTTQTREFLHIWKKPCWVQKDWGDELPVHNPYIYPIEEVMEKYCPRPADLQNKPYPYFTNSIDYMICLAGLRGYEEIQLYGTDMISEADDEYYKMRQSVNYYIGKVEGHGVKVVIQPHSSLLKTDFWYAYEDRQKDSIEDDVRGSLQKIQDEKADAQLKITEQQMRLQACDGAEQVIRQLITAFDLRAKGAQI
jgi:hypothetical protein